MMMRSLSESVGMISLREDSGFSGTPTPAAASSGRVSSKMRPLDSARVRGGRAMGILCLLDALDIRAQRLELVLHAFVAAVQMVDAFDGGLAAGRQAGDHQAGRGAQVG